MHQVFRQQPSLESFSIARLAASADIRRERGYTRGSTPSCDSTVAPCLRGRPVFLQRHFLLWIPPHFPSGHLLTVNRSPCPWSALWSPWSSSQPSCSLVGHSLCSGVPRAEAQLSVWFSLHSGYYRSPASPQTASNASLMLQLISLNVGISPMLLAPPPLAAGPFPLALLLLLPSFFHFTQLCVGPYNSFWSVTPTCLQQVFYVGSVDFSWCISGERCIPHLRVLPPSC